MVFRVSIDNGTPIEVIVRASATNGEDGTAKNTKRSDLVADINNALAQAGLSGKVVAGINNKNFLTLTAKQSLSFLIEAVNPFLSNGQLYFLPEARQYEPAAPYSSSFRKASQAAK